MQMFWRKWNLSVPFKEPNSLCMFESVASQDEKSQDEIFV